MTVTLLLFAGAREAAGRARDEIDVAPGATAGDVKAAAVARFPALAELATALQVAVDREIVPPETPVRPGAEVALLPPVAGGSGEGRFRLEAGPLRPEEAERLVRDSGFGALVTFAGTVRGEGRVGRVVRIDYEAYEPMALRQMAALAARIEAARGARLALFHRVGPVAPGEIAVVVCAAAPHRGPAFRACEEAVAALKVEAAIWKREVGVDRAEWIGSSPSSGSPPRPRGTES